MATGCVATRPRPSGVGAASTEAPGAASTPASPTYRKAARRAQARARWRGETLLRPSSPCRCRPPARSHYLQHIVSDS